MAFRGFSLIFVDFRRFPFLDFLGFSWIFADFRGFSWIFVDVRWFSWIFVDFRWFVWIFVPGFSQILDPGNAPEILKNSPKGGVNRKLKKTRYNTKKPPGKLTKNAQTRVNKTVDAHFVPKRASTKTLTRVWVKNVCQQKRWRVFFEPKAANICF